jgi:hypothetical protein
MKRRYVDVAFRRQRSCAYSPDLSSRVRRDDTLRVCSGNVIMLSVCCWRSGDMEVDRFTSMEWSIDDRDLYTTTSKARVLVDGHVYYARISNTTARRKFLALQISR